MKKIIISIVKCAVVFIMILTLIVSLLLATSVKRRIDSLDSLYSVIDYNIITPRPKYWEISAKENAEEKKAATAEFRKYFTDEMKTKLFKTIYNTEGFYPVFRASYNFFDIWISSSELPHYPAANQMVFSYGYGLTDRDCEKNYDKYRKKFESGQTLFQTFCCRQIDYRIEGTYYLPLYEGELNDFSIKYSDYINTGTPLPVVIGYDLRDLFSVGDTVDALAMFALTNEQSKAVGSSEDDCNIKLKVVGVLSEQAYALSPNGAIPEIAGLNTAIIMPYFDALESIYDNEIDSISAGNIGGSITNLSILTMMSPEEGDEKFSAIIKELGLENIYSGTNLNVTYVVKGVSLDTYRSVITLMVVASLALLTVAMVGGIIISVNRNVRKYSIHFLVGADKGFFLKKTVLPILCMGLCACTAANILFWLCDDIIKRAFGALSLSPAETILISLAIFVGVAAFVFLVALIKINKTDFSRTLKEDI